MVTRSIAKGYAAWVAVSAGNKRLVQLSRSDDRGHCLAIVTRSVAKVTPRGLRLSKTKTMDSMGVAPQGTTAKKEPFGSFFAVLFPRGCFNPPLHMYHTTIAYSFQSLPNLSIAI